MKYKFIIQQDDNDPPHGVIAITNFNQLEYQKDKLTQTTMFGSLTVPEIVLI